MKIKNTDGAYCKVKDIKISGNTAYVTLLIYSAVMQTTADAYNNVNRVFCFYIKNTGSTELIKASQNNYWIDRHNNYSFDSNNIDINMHKEIILSIDITNNNQSGMKDNKWVRNCKIVLVDHTHSFEEAWESEELTLISKSIVLPDIKNLTAMPTKTGNITIRFNYVYETQEDFNYINENLCTEIIIRSIYTNQQLELGTINHSDLINSSTQTIVYSSKNTYTEPVTLDIKIKNLHGDTLKELSQMFNQAIGSINLTTLTNHSPARVIAMSIKDKNISPIIAIKNK